jgi:hypothetical protein
MTRICLATEGIEVERRLVSEVLVFDIREKGVDVGVARYCWWVTELIVGARKEEGRTRSSSLALRSVGLDRRVPDIINRAHEALGLDSDAFHVNVVVYE